jgi:hypothetical protein
MARRSNSVNMTPAFAGSLILHAGLFVLVLILGMYFKKPPSMPGGVPVTIVSEGPPQFSNAPLADEEQVSQAETVAEIDEPEVAPALGAAARSRDSAQAPAQAGPFAHRQGQGHPRPETWISTGC